MQAFFFKDRLGLGHNDRLVAMMGTWTEGLVGVSLIAIGLLGLKESLLDYEETPVTNSAGSAVVDGAGGAGAAGKSGGGGKAIFLNGVLHGFSWDGAPSLAPALALSSWGSVLWFLLAYCSGTMVSCFALEIKSRRHGSPHVPGLHTTRRAWKKRVSEATSPGAF